MGDSEVSRHVDFLVMRKALEEVSQFFVVRIVPWALRESYEVEKPSAPREIMVRNSILNEMARIAGWKMGKGYLRILKLTR